MIYGGIEHDTWAFLRGEGRFAVDEAADGILQILRGGIAAETVRAAAAAELPDVVERLERVAARLEREQAEKARSQGAERRARVPQGPRRKPR